MKTNPSGYLTPYNPKLASGYYCLESLAKAKCMTIEGLLTMYDIECNEDKKGVFYNIVGKGAVQP